MLMYFKIRISSGAGFRELKCCCSFSAYGWYQVSFYWKQQTSGIRISALQPCACVCVLVRYTGWLTEITPVSNPRLIRKRLSGLECFRTCCCLTHICPALVFLCCIKKIVVKFWVLGCGILFFFFLFLLLLFFNFLRVKWRNTHNSSDFVITAPL